MNLANNSLDVHLTDVSFRPSAGRVRVLVAELSTRGDTISSPCAGRGDAREHGRASGLAASNEHFKTGARKVAARKSAADAETFAWRDLIGKTDAAGREARTRGLKICGGRSLVGCVRG